MSSRNSIPAEDSRRLLVQRILSSNYLSKSARLSEMFLYLCNRVLDDSADDIHEQEVGRNVFGRPVDYDTIADNIVRVHASMLRKRIDQYFSVEGVDEPWVIDIPKGNYAPVFHKRAPLSAPVPVGIVAPSEPLPPAADPAPPHSTRWRTWLPAALAVLFACTTCYLFVRYRALENGAAASIPANQPAVRQFWSQVFVPGGATYIVLDDAAVGLYQEVTGRQVALSEYFDRSYRDIFPPASSPRGLNSSGLDPALENALLLKRQSAYENVALLPVLMQTASMLRSSVNIQFARSVSFHDVRSGNAILLGNGQSNPWIQPFESHLTLQWHYDRTGDVWYPVDTKAADPDVYRNAVEMARDSYATVALLPNLSGDGSVLIVSGTGGSATSAALGFLRNEPSLDQLRVRLAHRSGAAFGWFEILLQVETRNNLQHQPTVLICRQPQS